MNKKSNNNKILYGILWICSGFIMLVLVAFFQIIANFLLSGNLENTSSLSVILNIISWILGTLGIVLIFVGPIVGIIKLTKKD